MVEVIIMSQTFWCSLNLIKLLALLDEKNQLNRVDGARPWAQLDLGLHLDLPVDPRHVAPEP